MLTLFKPDRFRKPVRFYIQGLVAQGRTITETLEIARDAARKLLEAQTGENVSTKLNTIDDNFEYPLVVGF